MTAALIFTAAQVAEINRDYYCQNRDYNNKRIQLVNVTPGPGPSILSHLVNGQPPPGPGALAASVQPARGPDSVTMIIMMMAAGAVAAVL